MSRFLYFLICHQNQLSITFNIMYSFLHPKQCTFFPLLVSFIHVMTEKGTFLAFLYSIKWDNFKCHFIRQLYKTCVMLFFSDMNIVMILRKVIFSLHLRSHMSDQFIRNTAELVSNEFVKS